MEEMVSVDIENITRTTRDGIMVIVKRTGKPAWLPRNLAEFMPGRAIIPVRLARKILGESNEKSVPELPPAA